jgi:hypothetical protein
MMKKVFFIAILVLFFMNSDFALAQLSKGDITLTTNPSYPKAGEKVIAKIESYSVDLTKSYIIWKLNDEVRLNGIGKNSFAFTLGEVSSKNDLSVSIETLDGKTLTKTQSIVGADMDLLWEATNSYVPPFYKGKALFAREGEIKVTAIPFMAFNNGQVSPNTLSYTWEKDGNGDVKASGFGKTYFTYKNSFLDKTNEIRATISDINTNVRLNKSIFITPIEPKIVLYKKTKEEILFNKSIENNFYLNQEGDTFIALPYFFSPKNINSSDIKISWFVNGEQILNTIGKNELFVKPAEGKSGEANIRVIIENLSTLFQTKEKRVTVNF